MSDLGKLAIALAMNPELAKKLKDDPESASESVGLNLSSDDLDVIRALSSSATVATQFKRQLSVKSCHPACAKVSAKIRTNSADRARFLDNPASYLRENDIHLADELIPSKQELQSAFGGGLSRLDPGSVAIAV